MTTDLRGLQRYDIHVPRASSYFAVNLKLRNSIKCSIILAFGGRDQCDKCSGVADVVKFT